MSRRNNSRRLIIQNEEAPRAIPNRVPQAPIVPPVPGFETVIFLDLPQRDRFVRLMGKEMVATRCYSRGAFRGIGWSTPLEAILRGTGMGFIINCREKTYRDLTLEFLSSFNWDKRRNTVSYRLENRPHAHTLNDFGAIFGFERTTDINPPAEFSFVEVWHAITGSYEFNTTRLHISSIEHPWIKMWFRIMAGTFFARKEKGNATKTEVGILGAFLNVQRQPRFSLMLIYWVVAHWERLALGQRSRIEIGAFVTVLAKHHNHGFVGENRPHSVADPVPLLLLEDIKKEHGWFGRKGGVWHWRITKGRSIPVTHPLPPVFALPPSTGNEPAPSYLLGDCTTASGPMEDAPPRRPQPHHAPPYAQQPPQSAPYMQQQPQYVQPWPGMDAYQVYTANLAYARALDQEKYEYRKCLKLKAGGFMEKPGPFPDYWNPDTGAYMEEKGVGRFDLSTLQQALYAQATASGAGQAGASGSGSGQDGGGGNDEDDEEDEEEEEGDEESDDDDDGEEEEDPDAEESYDMEE